MANGTAAVVAGMVIGAIAGASIALLYAPMTGEETRRNLRGSADRLAKRARGIYDEAADTLADLAEGGSELVDEMKDASARMRAARS